MDIVRHVKPRAVWTGYRNQYNNVTVNIYANTISVNFCLRQYGMDLNLKYSPHRYRRADMAGYRTLISVWQSQKFPRESRGNVRFLVGLKIARKRVIAREKESRAGRSIDNAAAATRPWETERSISRRRGFSYKFSRTLDLLRTEEFNL